MATVIIKNMVPHILWGYVYFNSIDDFNVFHEKDLEPFTIKLIDFLNKIKNFTCFNSFITRFVLSINQDVSSDN